MRPFRIGILGCANIARTFITHVAPSTLVRVDAVASRDGAKAAAFAAEFGIGRHFDSYEALLADPALDIIYNPLPNSLHAQWSIRAAQHGKHVLCEKPLAMGRAEAVAMFDAARAHDVMLLEAYPYWFQPQTADMLRLLADGSIGSVRTVQANFGFTLAKPQGNIRFDSALGGGALLDVGSYTASFIRLVMGQAPVSVRADATWADSGVDLATSATLYYADGRRALMHCAMNMGNHRQALVVGSDGVIETEFLNHTSDQPSGDALGHLPSLMRVRRGRGPAPFETVTSPCGSGFRFAAEAFAKVIAAHDTAAIERAAAASVDIATTLQALALSAREARAVSLAEI